MNKNIKFNQENYFLNPINSILKSRTNKEDFDFCIYLIGKVQDPIEKLQIFNEFMSLIYIKTSQGDIDSSLAAVVAHKDTSEQLSNFLKTFGSNWENIKSKIPKENIDLIEDALKFSNDSIKLEALFDEQFDMSIEQRINLINSLHNDVSKELCISQSEIQKHRLTPEMVGDIVCNFLHDYNKLNYISQNSDSLPFGKKQLVEISNSLILDNNRIKFLNPKNVDSFGFTSVDCKNIINGIKSDSLTLLKLNEFLADNLSVNLSAEQICSIISNLHEDTNKLNFLSPEQISKLFEKCNPEDVEGFTTEFACSLNDDNNKKHIIEPETSKKLNLGNDSIAIIASTLVSDNNKREIISKSKELNLTPINIAKIVSSYSKLDEKIKYIESFSDSEDHGFEKSIVIASLNDFDLIKKYIQEPDVANYKNAVILGLFNLQKDVPSVDFDRVCELAGIDPNELHSLDIPVLPDKMTIGSELETIGKNQKGNTNIDLFNQFDYVFGKFKTDKDRSIRGYNSHRGLEFVSPVLKNHNLENLNLVAKLLQMNDLGTNSSCGAHVHVGADYLDSKEAWENLTELYGNNEDLFFQISHHHGTGFREGGAEFTASISPKMEESLNTGNIYLSSNNDLNDFVHDLKHLQQGKYKEFPHIFKIHPEINPDDQGLLRYYAFHTGNVDDIKKNTIEFRLPNGTINPQTLMNNIRLFSTLVAVSKELGDAEIAFANNEMLTEKQSRLLVLRNSMLEKSKGDPKSNQQERLSALMNLLFDEDENSKNIYLKRYNTFPKDSISDIEFGFPGYIDWYKKRNATLAKAVGIKNKTFMFASPSYEDWYKQTNSKIPDFLNCVINNNTESFRKISDLLEEKGLLDEENDLEK